MLLFELPRPARIRVTVYGPGPSCKRLGTFGRRGRAGLNRIALSGSLYGRPLPPGRYMIVVQAIRGGRVVSFGYVVVTILPRDGREGGSRPLAAPNCAGSFRSADFVALGGGVFGGTAASGRAGRDASGEGVAGVRASREAGGPVVPFAPDFPPRPDLPTIVANDRLPPWAFATVAVLGTLAGAAFIAFGVHRSRTTWE